MTGFSGFLGSMRGTQEDKPDPLTRAMLAPDRPEQPYDADETAANLMAAGLAPGQVTDLARRYGDTLAELAGVQEANEAARRQQERIARDHAAGRITAFDIMRMDTSEPDVAAEQRLSRRADTLRQQLAGVQALITPAAQRAPDPLEAASRHAHEVFREVTRQRMAEAQAGRPARRPFTSASRGGVAVRSEVTCAECRQVGASPQESALIHLDPDAPIEEELAGLPVSALAEFDREDEAAERRERRPRRYDASGREITRAAADAQREARARLAGHEVARTVNDAIVSVR